MMAGPSISTLKRAILLLAGSLAASAAHASLAVLVGEPFGNFGTMMPVGHTAIYLDHLCADGPLKLRECLPGEPEGVVLARYHRVGQLDWIASPVLEFLYATDNPATVPRFVTPELAWDLRRQYRQRFLQALIPDGTEREKSTDEWWETAGVTFNRRVWGYQIDTTPAQDRAFLDAMNHDPNHHLYHLRKTNCANFAADLVNLYFPGTVRGGDHIADMGLMTPKHVARCVYELGRRDPALHLRVMEIPQLPGSLRRSRPVRGSWEAGLKTKRYLFTLLAVQPEIPLVGAVLYAIHGRWPMNPPELPAEVVGPYAFTAVAPGRLDPINTESARVSSLR